MRKVVTSLLIGLAILALAIPLYVHLTYPSMAESEVTLERAISDTPFRLPPFLLGSIGYGLNRGRLAITKATIVAVDHNIYVYRQEVKERALLLLMPYYVERVSGRTVTGDHLKALVLPGNATLLVEVFETHRGKIYVVVEIQLNGKIYRGVKSAGE